MKKRLISFYLVICMLAGTIVFPSGMQTVKAGQQEQACSTYHTGLLQEKIVELPPSAEDNELFKTAVPGDTDGDITAEDNIKASAIYTSEWDKYKTHYFYNQLSDAGREFYDSLDYAASKLLLQKVNANSRVIQGNLCYFTDLVAQSATLSVTEMQDIMLIFRYSNPQYYFLNSTVYTLSSGYLNYYAMGVYSSFASGAKRQTATAAVKNQVNAWVAAAGAYKTDAEKVLYFHDVILDKVYYNMDIINNDFNEDTQYTQSAYSVFCMDKTVCAGYSQSFAMLCNAVDIDAVSVTSLEHAWNKVRIDDTWYNVDLTWDDDAVGRYQFFERNDYYYDTVPDGNSPIYHREEILWEGMLPACTIDTVQTGDYSVPGTLPVVTQTVAAPNAEISVSGSYYKIKLTTSTSGADIYYTTDGTLPSPSSTKSHKYTGVIKTTTLPKLRIMAALNGRFDSTDVSYAMVGYKGNNASSGSVAPQICVAGGKVVLRANSFKRSGYKFAGWNTKADGSGVSYKPNQTISNLKSNLTLYAQWYQGKYQIIYQMNGGKNKSTNPSGYTPGKSITLKEPTKKGYTFAGWYTNKKLTKKFTKITKNTKGTLTLYAKWKKTKYSIVYNLNGGTNNKKNPKSYYITSNTITLQNPTRKGYTFVGWYSNQKCTRKVTQIKKGSTGKVTLYAKWKKK